MAAVEKKEQKSHLKRILYTILAFLIPLILFIPAGNLSVRESYDRVELDGCWKVYYRGRITEDAVLADFSTGGIVEGERATLETTLPDVLLFSPCITFKTRLSRVRVSLDSREIYSFGYDIPDGSFVPKCYHYVPIPSHFEGCTLRIEITAAEDHAFSGAYPVTLGNTEDLIRGYVHERRLDMLIGAFMFFFGCILAVLSPFLIVSAVRDISVIFSSMISILLGMYVLCYNEIMSYFTHSDTLSHLLEYVSLYFLPVAVAAYILTSGKARGRDRILKIILALDTIFAVSMVLMHVTGILMINKLLTLYHVMVVLECGYLLYLLGSRKKQEHRGRQEMMGARTERTLFFGIVIFILSIFAEILRYYLVNYVFRTDKRLGIDFITVGALAVVLSLMVNYFFHSIDHLTEARTRIKLHGMAYTDALTGIDNRASCDQFMAVLDNEGGDYAVVSLDLDGLKEVNDKQGHSIGDMMISGFGELLMDAFSECELVGRMGGDEFIVIRKNALGVDMERDIRSLVLGTEEANRRGGTFRYAFSYGVADSSEKDKVRDVYMLADERMYEMKEEHHKHRGGAYMQGRGKPNA